MNDPHPANHHQERLASFLDNAVDAIVTIDEKGIIDSANPATERLVGYSPDKLIGKNVRILMPRPYRDEHDQYIRNYLSTGQKKIIGIGREIVGQRADGTIFPLHLAVNEIRIGQRRLFTGVLRDISDVKSVEARLVQNERLAAIGQMVAGLAHESRNAFQRSHACLANLALDVQEMPESLALVHKVQNALDHLNSLLEEVRDYSAPIVLNESATVLDSMIRETWQQITTASPESSAIRFQLECPEDFPSAVRVDRVRLGQVVWNLLENARAACESASDAGQIRVRLTVNKNADHFQIAVCDNGPGIEESRQQTIFEPFYTTKTRGTGLGLAICRRIIDAHGGRLACHTNEFGGACFTIQIPFSHGHPD